MENSDNNYTGLEVCLVELIFQKLNLTAKYSVSPNRKDSFFPMITETIQQIQSASSDIGIGALHYHASTVGNVETTIPYLYVTASWYIPCPNQASRWTSIYKIFSFHVWASFGAAAILAVILMWLLAKYETQLHFRESQNYMTIMYCIYNVCAVLTGVSVPQKPISLSLRIFFTAWVWYSIAMTTVFQAYFIGHLINPGFEESITTLNELIQSGLEYGYPGDGDHVTFSDPQYEIIRKNRKVCKSLYSCLQRVIQSKDFATIFDSFHEEYLRTMLFFRNIQVPLCTLQENIFTFRLTMYMAKGNPLLHKFNKIITRIFEAGLERKWMNNFVSSSKLDDNPIDDNDTNFLEFATSELKTNNTTFSLFHLQAVFYILLIGQLFSAFVFLVEVLYHRACITVRTNTTR
jgi:hypothetical protein